MEAKYSDNPEVHEILSIECNINFSNTNKNE